MSLAKYLAKLHLDMAPNAMAGKRAKAVRAVRDVVRESRGVPMGKEASYLDHGYSLVTHSHPETGQVVKIPHGGMFAPMTPQQQMTRRLHMKDLLHQRDAGPETFLVQTERSPYLVQEAAKPGLLDYETTHGFTENLSDAGFLPNDVLGSNVMRGPEDQPWVVDSGLMKYPDLDKRYAHRPELKWGTAPVQTETDRARARSRRITRKGER